MQKIIMKIDGYKFGNKNNWRRWAWNRINERYSLPKKDAIIIYLAGKEDLDRKIAIEKGFNPNNMIAVDKNPDVIKHLRNKNVTCIEGDIIEVISNFKYTKSKINILIADFCCGLNNNIHDLSLFLTTSSIGNSFDNDSILLFNFMRGRDKSLLLEEYKNECSYYSIKPETHRGCIFTSFRDKVAAPHNITLIKAQLVNSIWTQSSYPIILTSALKSPKKMIFITIIKKSLDKYQTHSQLKL